MKAIIPFHSFVDLITNSSSELFICDTDKSVNTVKEIIKELAELYNKGLSYSEKNNCNTINIKELWTTVFKEPEVVKYSFDLHQFPDYDEWMAMFGTGYHFDPTHAIEKKAFNKLSQWRTENPEPPYKTNMTKTEERKYEKVRTKYWAEKDKAEEVYYAEWTKMRISIYSRLYSWAAKQNNIDLSELGRLDCQGGQWQRPFFPKMTGEFYKQRKDAKEARFIYKINEALSWRYSFKKGNIILESASDNTVPYDFFSDIENTFNCNRIHMG